MKKIIISIIIAILLFTTMANANTVPEEELEESWIIKKIDLIIATIFSLILLILFIVTEKDKLDKNIVFIILFWLVFLIVAFPLISLIFIRLITNPDTDINFVFYPNFIVRSSAAVCMIGMFLSDVLNEITQTIFIILYVALLVVAIIL